MRKHSKRMAAVGVLVSMIAVGCSDDASQTTATQQSTVAATSGIERVSASEFRDVLADPTVVLIDVRSPAEFVTGHIDGAINIDLNGSSFADEVAGLPIDVHYAVYCQSDNRSGQAVKVMEEAGFVSISELDDGIASWVAAGFPTVTDPTS